MGWLAPHIVVRMGSKRAAGLLFACAATAAFLWTIPGYSSATQGAEPSRRVSLVVLPEAEADEVFAGRAFALGLGVFPQSRDGVRFVEEISRAAPKREGSSEPVRLTDVLRSAGAQVLSGGFAEGAIGPRLEELFEPNLRAELGLRRVLDIYAFQRSEDFLRVVPTSRSSTIIVVALGDRTPTRVGVCVGCAPRGGSPSAILTGGTTRRPGLVTPYDIGATIIDRLGVDPIPSVVAGEPLKAERHEAPRDAIDSLAARLERDDSYAPGLAAVTVSLGVVTIFLGYGLMRAGRRDAALRVAQGGVLVLPGWVVAIFVPTGRWYLRALVVVVAALLGGAMRPRVPLSTMARIGLVSAIGFGALAAIAPLNPGGEPGLSIWGNPLVSWRFFGLQNVEAAIVASGIVIWGTVAGLTAPLLAAIAVAAAVVTGAPTIGANFVGVLTFVFGGAAVTIALARRRANLGHVVVAGLTSVAAFALALLADAGSPVSHGGRAARKISDGGLAAAWDLVEGRLKLNWELIGDFTGGVLWVIGLAISLAMLIRWGLNAERGPFRGRVAVLGGALMAAASLVLEDSGFYSGAVLWFVTMNAWLLIRLTAPGSGVIPPETDAPPAGVGAGTKPPQPGAARRPRSSRG